MEEIEFYEAEDSQQPVNNQAQRPRKKLIKFVFIALVVLASLLVLVAAYFFWQLKIRYDKIFFGSNQNSTLENAKNFVLPDKLAGEENGKINLLFIGMRGKEMEGKYLSSAMMVVSFDLKNHKINLVSIPRDLWIQIGGASGKANSVYKTAAMVSKNNPEASLEFTKETYSETLGIKVNYIFVCDFDEFENLIDHIGKIDVQMSSEEAARYPFLTDSNMKDSADEHAPGLYHFTGEQSLEFVRWPINAVPDFDRLRRMQLFLFSFAKQYVDAGSLTSYKTAYNTFGSLNDGVLTDLRIWEAKRLISIAEDIPFGSISQHRLTTNIGTDGGLLQETKIDFSTAYIPAAGENDFSQIQQWLKGIAE